MVRGQTIARIGFLTIAVGIGIAMLLKPGDEEVVENLEPVAALILRGVDDCLELTKRTDEECNALVEDVQSKNLYFGTRYTKFSDCQNAHGADGCLGGLSVNGKFVPVTPDGFFRPRAYAIAVTAPGGEEIPAQPIHKSVDGSEMITLKRERFAAAWGTVTAPGGVRTLPQGQVIMIRR